MIELDLDGRFVKGIFFDDKSYVLVKYPEDIVKNESDKTIKGNTLTGRSNEGFVLDFISKSIEHILNEEWQQIRVEYDMWKERIELYLMDVDEVKKRQSLNMSMSEYKHKIAAGQNRIAQYEAAINGDRDYIKGDVIETWIEEPEIEIKTYKNGKTKEVIPNLAAYETIRNVNKWNGNIFRKHYISRLENTVRRFIVIIGLDEFKETFPEISVRKDDIAKFIPIWGIEKFSERFPDFGYREKDINKMSEQDLTYYNSNIKK